MAHLRKNYIPGPVFNDAFVAGLKLKKKTQRQYAREQGVTEIQLRNYSMGVHNGPVSKAARERMIKEIGRETFDFLYAQRLSAEDAA